MTTELRKKATSSLAELQMQIDGLDEAALQRLLTAVTRSYARRSLDQRDWAIEPFAPDAEMTATEALVTAGAILRAAEISSFELATIFNI
jgi:hypothetical protein